MGEDHFDALPDNALSSVEDLEGEIVGLNVFGATANDVAVVPLPAGVLLLVSCLAGLGLFRRRGQAASSGLNCEICARVGRAPRVASPHFCHPEVSSSRHNLLPSGVWRLRLPLCGTSPRRPCRRVFDAKPQHTVVGRFPPQRSILIGPMPVVRIQGSSGPSRIDHALSGFPFPQTAASSSNRSEAWRRRRSNPLDRGLIALKIMRGPAMGLLIARKTVVF